MTQRRQCAITHDEVQHRHKQMTQCTKRCTEMIYDDKTGCSSMHDDDVQAYSDIT